MSTVYRIKLGGNKLTTVGYKYGKFHLCKQLFFGMCTTNRANTYQRLLA